MMSSIIKNKLLAPNHSRLAGSSNKWRVGRNTKLPVRSNCQTALSQAGVPKFALHMTLWSRSVQACWAMSFEAYQMLCINYWARASCESRGPKIGTRSVIILLLISRNLAPPLLSSSLSPLLPLLLSSPLQRLPNYCFPSCFILNSLF